MKQNEELPCLSGRRVHILGGRHDGVFSPPPTLARKARLRRPEAGRARTSPQARLGLAGSHAAQFSKTAAPPGGGTPPRKPLASAEKRPLAERPHRSHGGDRMDSRL